MSSQIQNLKLRTTKEKIKHIVILFFSLFLISAVFSQVEPKATSDVAFGSGKNLQPNTYNLKPSDWLYYKSSNDLSAYLGKKSSTLPTVRYQKNNDYLEFSLNNVSSTTSASLETNTKTPNTPTLFYRNAFNDTDVTYQITNIPFKVKEEIVLKQFPISPPATPERSNGGRGNFQFPINDQIFKDSISKQIHFLFSAETSAKPVKQKDGSIAFFGDNGEYLFQLDKPFMIDANLNRSEKVTIEIIPKSEVLISNKIPSPPDAIIGASNNSIFKLILGSLKAFLPLKISNWKFIDNWPLKIENSAPKSYQIVLSADSAWLSTATYPVIIDPTVTHNADANFTGQFNRIADSDTTSSTQLESSYPEQTKDPYTVLLLHFNEANGTTAGIRDYASTTRVITANGNASTTSYVTQLGLGNSAAFDGTGDYLSLADSEDWQFDNNDFTLNFWVNPRSLSASSPVIDMRATELGTGFLVEFVSSKIRMFGNNTAIINEANSSNTIPTNTWTNVTITRNGNTINSFINGLIDQSVNYSGVFNNHVDSRIGASLYSGTYLNGYLDEFRIIKGRALTPEEIKAAASRRPYAVYTSPVIDATASVAWNTVNWTERGVNTGNGEQPYSTNSLVAQWDFNDTSGTTLTASSSGSCTTACNGTLTNFAYTASQDQATTTTGWTANNKKWGAGALMMESAAAADYVSITDPASNVLDPGTGDFTIEGWIKSSTAGQDTIIQNNTTVGACAANAGYVLIVNGNRNLAAYASDGTTCYVNNLTANASSTEIADGRWHYFALSVDRDTKAYNYIDGRLATSTTINNTTAANPAATIYFGASGATGDSDIILDSARYYSRALSASEILSNYNAGNIEIQTRAGATSDPNDGSWEAWKPTTGETQLLSLDSDKGNWSVGSDNLTKLLLHNDASGTTFTDSSVYNKTVTALAGATQTTTSIFVGNSAVFDGAGDGVCVADSDDWAFGQNFTIDFDFKYNTTSRTNSVLYEQFVDSNNFVHLSDHANGNLYFVVHSGGVPVLDYYVANWNPGTTKHHLEITRSGANVYMFIDGVSQTLSVNTAVGTGVIPNLSASACFGGTGSSFLGYGSITWDSMNGWMDEIRISNVARHANNFAVPTLAYLNNGLVIKKSDEGTIKMEGASSTKLTLGAPQIDGNTVALWHMEETGTTTGTYLYDETANNNDATTTGTTVVDGIFGKARKFNGTSDVVSKDSGVSGIGGSNQMTYSAWIKRSRTNGGSDGIYQLGNNAIYDYQWLVIQANKIRADFGNDANNDFKTFTTTNTITDNNWHYIVATYNAGTIRVYVDGVEWSGTSGGTWTGNVVTKTTLLRIGSLFGGTIDTVAIYHRVLSPDEIAETYRMGANHHLTRQVSAVDLSAQTKLAFWIAADRPGTGLEAMFGESDYANYELASSTLAFSTNTVLYIKGDEIASSTSIKDSSFSGKAITANGNARTAGGGKIGNSVYFDGTGDYLTVPASSDWGFGAGDFAIDMWVYPTGNPSAITGLVGLGAASSDSFIYTKHSASSGNMQASMRDTGGVTYIYTTKPISLNVWQHIALIRNGNNLNFYLNSNLIGSADITGKTMVANGNVLAIGIDDVGGVWPFLGYIDEVRVIKGSTLTPDQIRQAYEYGLRTHQITIDFGATLQSSDLISSATDYNFSITATTSGLSATTSGLYLGDKIIIKENLGGTEYTAQGTVNSINTTTGAITVPSWDTGSTFPSGNGYSPNATVFKWQREYFDLTGSLSTHRNAVTNLTLRPTNGAEGRTIYLDDFRYNTNYLTASSSSAITSGNNRYLQYRAIFTSTDTFVSPFLTAFNTLYTALANSFPAIIGISGGGFLSF